MGAGTTGMGERMKLRAELHAEMLAKLAAHLHQDDLAKVSYALGAPPPDARPAAPQFKSSILGLVHARARAMYAAYGANRGWASHDGKPMPAWGKLPPVIVHGWEAAAGVTLSTPVPGLPAPTTRVQVTGRDAHAHGANTSPATLLASNECVGVRGMALVEYEADGNAEWVAAARVEPTAARASLLHRHPGGYPKDDGAP